MRDVEVQDQECGRELSDSQSLLSFHASLQGYRHQQKSLLHQLKQGIFSLCVNFSPHSKPKRAKLDSDLASQLCQFLPYKYMQACWFTESEHYFVLGVGTEATEMSGLHPRVLRAQAPRCSQQMGLLPERKSS